MTDLEEWLAQIRLPQLKPQLLEWGVTGIADFDYLSNNQWDLLRSSLPVVQMVRLMRALNGNPEKLRLQVKLQGRRNQNLLCTPTGAVLSSLIGSVSEALLELPETTASEKEKQKILSSDCRLEDAPTHCGQDQSKQMSRGSISLQIFTPTSLGTSLNVTRRRQHHRSVHRSRARQKLRQDRKQKLRETLVSLSQQNPHLMGSCSPRNEQDELGVSFLKQLKTLKAKIEADEDIKWSLQQHKTEESGKIDRKRHHKECQQMAMKADNTGENEIPLPEEELEAECAQMPTKDRWAVVCTMPHAGGQGALPLQQAEDQTDTAQTCCVQDAHESDSSIRENVVMKETDELRREVVDLRRSLKAVVDARKKEQQDQHQNQKRHQLQLQHRLQEEQRWQKEQKEKDRRLQQLEQDREREQRLLEVQQHARDAKERKLHGALIRAKNQVEKAEVDAAEMRQQEQQRITKVEQNAAVERQRNREERRLLHQQYQRDLLLERNEVKQARDQVKRAEKAAHEARQAAMRWRGEAATIHGQSQSIVHGQDEEGLQVLTQSKSLPQSTSPVMRTRMNSSATANFTTTAEKSPTICRAKAFAAQQATQMRYAVAHAEEKAQNLTAAAEERMNGPWRASYNCSSMIVQAASAAFGAAASAHAASQTALTVAAEGSGRAAVAAARAALLAVNVAAASVGLVRTTERMVCAHATCTVSNVLESEKDIELILQMELDLEDREEAAICIQALARAHLCKAEYVRKTQRQTASHPPSYEQAVEDIKEKSAFTGISCGEIVGRKKKMGNRRVRFSFPLEKPRGI